MSRRLAQTALLRLLGTAFLAVLSAGCLGMRLDKMPLDPVPAGQAELDAFLEHGRDSRASNITIYKGTTGKAVFEFANRPWDGKATLAKFVGDKKSRLPILEAKTALNAEFGFLLDPTARQSWCLYDSIRAMDYRPFREPPGNDPVGEYPDHVISAVPGYAGVANKIIFGTLHIESPVFYVPPAHGLLGPLARPQAVPEPGRPKNVQKALDRARKQAHAVMGAALMQKFSFIRVDFRGRTATLASSLAYKPAGFVVAKLPMTLRRERPTIEATLDGVPTPCLIDLAGDFVLSVPEAKADDVSLRLGNYDLGRPPVVTHESIGLPADSLPRIGWQLWREYAVTLDFKQSTLWLEDVAPSAAPAADPDIPAPNDPDASDAPIHYRGIMP